ncbi:polysaccharide deacetylase family protein [Paenibacillus sp. CC-CFT747]|nr:polysaccharide deacetylase family protein [Paenibacillus sp. CC-CFT747]
MKRTFAAITLMSLLLAACGSESPSVNGESPSPSASGAPAPTVSTSPSPSPSPSLSPSPSPSPSPVPTEAPKAYKMNKNYDMIPIDPAGNKKVVLLTFDDGPKEKGMIDGLINTLDKHKAKAIFFVNGYRIKEHPELLKLIHDRGQVIGNHSYDHISLRKETNDKVDYQIGEVQKQVKEVTGTTPAFFRPPFGEGSDYVREKAKKENLLYMTWSNGSLDWDLPKNSTDKPQAVIDNVMKQLHPGSNILMHELAWTVETLDNLLTQLEAKGYSFVDPRSIDTQQIPQ